MIYRLIFVCLVGFFSSHVFAEPMKLKSVSIGQQSFILEVAATAEQRSRGLMEREYLAVDRGMLFNYPAPGKFRIWMKNTLIPLKVLWIDKDLKIQAIKTLFPCDDGDCPSFGIEERSRYVIELNADVQGIRIGMPVLGLE